MNTYGRWSVGVFLVVALGWSIYFQRQVSPATLLETSDTSQAHSQAGAKTRSDSANSAKSNENETQAAGVGSQSSNKAFDTGPQGVQASNVWGQAKAIVSEMDKLLDCFKSQDCALDHSTANSYHFAVQAGLVRQARQLKDLILSDGYANPSFLGRAAVVARKLLEFPDDDVRESALELVHVLPASSQNAEAILSSLSESVSAPLYREAMEELLRYAGTPAQEKIDSFLIRTLQTGSPYAAKEVAKRSLAFISDGNVGQFQQVMQEYPARSTIHKMLKLNISEYKRGY